MAKQELDLWSVSRNIGFVYVTANWTWTISKRNHNADLICVNIMHNGIDDILTIRFFIV